MHFERKLPSIPAFNLMFTLVTAALVVGVLIQAKNYADRREALNSLPSISIKDLQVQEPVVEGGSLSYSRELCNLTDFPVSGGVQRRIIDVNTERDEIIVVGSSSIELEAGECQQDTQSFILPTEVKPGMWKLRVIAATTVGTGALVSATSEPFEVMGSQ